MAAILGLATLGNTLPVRSTAAGAQADGIVAEALDIDVDVRDLVLGVESLDGSVADAESSQEFQSTLAGDVLFAFNKADLAPVAAAILTELADTIKAKARGTVRIDGYTDSMGTPAYNQDLSQRRAAAVEGALRPLLTGVPAQIQVAGHGAADPVALNTNPDGSDNPAGRAKNRRVTITFSK